MHMIAHRLRALRPASEDGFTMLFALLALFVGTLLVAAAFTAANGDIKLTHRATLQSKAYYAAVAGVNRYQYQLTNSPEYWTKCPTLGTESVPLKVTGSTDENYTVKTVGSTGHTCESGKQATILETSGAAKGTFRILSTGTVKEGTTTITRKIVATFSHPGFTKYVYESNFEVEDPVNFGIPAKTCEFYYTERLAKGLTGTCKPIQFAPTDEVNGPMHTNDAAAVCTSGGNAPKFGREGRNDEIAMGDVGHYAASGCSNTPNIVGQYTTTAASVLPPPTDVELLEAAGTKYDGRTEIELMTGSPNKMKVTNKGVTTTVNFPSNGVVYVENSKSESCAITNYTPFGPDTTDDTGCGNVYVHGKYTESLTIASADDVIVNGDLTTTTTSTGEPTGGATLGLIAENFVRVYHPVRKGYTAEPHVHPATEPAYNAKCVIKKELTAKIRRSTEVTGINTSGLSVGDEVEGAVAGQTESGTKIASIKESENKLILSKATKPAGQAASGKVTKSTEITGITTTGLEVGEEVEGFSGQFEAGTTITEIKAGNKIKVSQAPNGKEVSAKITSGSTEVTSISTTGLAVGQEVEGTVAGQIEAGTTITEIKTGSKIKISKAAKKSATTTLEIFGETATLKFYGENTTLKVYHVTGYAYNSTLGNCHKVESNPPYTEYRASENLYQKKCETNTTNTGEAFCEYENEAGGCSSKAENENAEEDPNGWGTQEAPVIDAAILSTNHSWIVDNYECGNQLGKLTVWGSIAQFWRGPVGQSGSGGSGYIKSYNYDDRLANQQPPSFLSPTNASSWRVSRETAAPLSFTG